LEAALHCVALQAAEASLNCVLGQSLQLERAPSLFGHSTLTAAAPPSAGWYLVKTGWKARAFSWPIKANTSVDAKKSILLD
jgi:hypothetical protein